MRRSPRPGKDKAYFKRTASSGKAVNLGVKLYRGGIRF